MVRGKLWRVAASAAFAVTLVVNALANILPINNLNTGQVSDLYPSLFTPAGFTFSIWSVIYLLLLGFVIFSWTRREDVVVEKVLPWFVLSCGLNATWIIAWHYLLPALSVLIMLGLLFTLVRIFRILQSHHAGGAHRIFVTVPFTIYLAWICVATIANISAFLVSVGWNGFNIAPDVWTVIMMSIAAGLGAVILFRHRKVEFAGVIIWALLGILLRWQNSEYQLIVYTSMALISLLVLASIIRLLVRTRSPA